MSVLENKNIYAHKKCYHLISIKKKISIKVHTEEFFLKSIVKIKNKKVFSQMYLWCLPLNITFKIIMKSNGNQKNSMFLEFCSHTLLVETKAMAYVTN